jgi:hypothetical protein
LSCHSGEDIVFVLFARHKNYILNGNSTKTLFDIEYFLKIKIENKKNGGRRETFVYVSTNMTFN